MFAFLQFFLLSIITIAPAIADDSFLKTPTTSRQAHSTSYEPLVANLFNYNNLLIQVKINGSITQTFLFDTGSNVSLISDRAVAEIKSKDKSVHLTDKVYSVDGKSVSGFTPDNLNMGGFNFKGFTLAVVPEKRLGFFGGKQVSGIIGLDIIKNLEYVFDFPKHQIFLYSPAVTVTPPDGSAPKYIAQGLTPEEISALGFANAKQAAIIDSAADRRKYVHALCGEGGKNGEEDLVFDTGSSATVISPSLADTLNVKPISENVLSTGFAGPEYLSTALLGQFQVGDLVLQNQMVKYSSQRAFDKNLPPTLGMDILSKYKMLVDFSSSKMYLKLPDAVPASVKVNIGPGTTPLAPTP